MKKVGRNDPCPCGSGKKFKKCCESKMIGKRFMASKIDTSSMMQKSAGLSSIFKKAVDLPSKITRVVTNLGDHSVQMKKKGEDKTDAKILNEEKDLLSSPKEEDTQNPGSSSK